MRNKKRSLDLTIRSSGKAQEDGKQFKRRWLIQKLKERVQVHCFIEEFSTERKEIKRILVWGDKRMQKKVQLGPKSVYKKKENRWQQGKDFRCKNNDLANGGKGVRMKTEVVIKEVRGHVLVYMQKGRISGNRLQYEDILKELSIFM